MYQAKSAFPRVVAVNLRVALDLRLFMRSNSLTTTVIGVYTILQIASTRSHATGNQRYLSSVELGLS